MHRRTRTLLTTGFAAALVLTTAVLATTGSAGAVAACSGVQ